MRRRNLLALVLLALLEAGAGVEREGSIPRLVTVYVFDTGVFGTHPELVGRVHLGYVGYPEKLFPCNSHGTAVASVIAGKTLGIAPRARVVDIRMVGCIRGKLGLNSKVLSDAIDSVLADHHRQHGGPAVANMSFIVDSIKRVPEMDRDIERLEAEGIIVVASAGNVDKNACKISPANSPGVIVVGAEALILGPDDEHMSVRMSGTAWGRCVHFYAPGERVVVANFVWPASPSLQVWGGTSMSAGYISGKVALYLENNPEADREMVVSYLRRVSAHNVVDDFHSTSTYFLNLGTRIMPEVKTEPSIGASSQ